MLNWLLEYWYLGLIALVIGVASGWWIWAQAPRTAALPKARAEPAVPLQPIRPDIIAAQPAQFAAAPVVDPVPLAAGTGAAPNIAAAVGAPDNLLLLKGVGPKLGALLVGLGVTRFDQIAAWTAGDVAAVDAHLGTFAGRIARDNWVDQAGYLARGDKPGFEAKYGALGSEL